mgnify:CR=1 FL=1
MEFESVPVYDLSLNVGYAFVRTDSDAITSREDMFEVKLGIIYDNSRLLRAELFGTYVYWNQQYSSALNNGSFYDFLWDLTLSKNLVLNDLTSLEGYLKVRKFLSICFFLLFCVHLGRRGRLLRFGCLHKL